SLLFPFLDGGAARQLFLDTGRAAVAETRGARAAIQIKNPKPTFYVRGISPAGGLYMVQEDSKQDHREVKMPVHRSFRGWAQFRRQDLREVDLRPVANDVYSVTPRMDLKAGEYAIASAADEQGRWIRLGFEFGVAAP